MAIAPALTSCATAHICDAASPWAMRVETAGALVGAQSCGHFVQILPRLGGLSARSDPSSGATTRSGLILGPELGAHGRNEQDWHRHAPQHLVCHATVQPSDQGRRGREST